MFGLRSNECLLIILRVDTAHLDHLIPLLLSSRDEVVQLLKPAVWVVLSDPVEGGHEDGDGITLLRDLSVTEGELPSVVGVLLRLLGCRGVLDGNHLVDAPALLVFSQKADLKSTVDPLIVGADLR